MRFYEPETRINLNMSSPKNIKYFDNLKKKNKELLQRLVPISNFSKDNTLSYEKSIKSPRYKYLQ